MPSEMGFFLSWWGGSHLVVLRVTAGSVLRDTTCAGDTTATYKRRTLTSTKVISPASGPHKHPLPALSAMSVSLCFGQLLPQPTQLHKVQRLTVILPRSWQ